jgi:predicted AAA+ superfamily ATPase
MIKRYLEDLVCHHINANKVILLFGARQVGKTTLLENLECLPKKETMFLNGDESDIRELFASPNSTRLKYIFAGYKFVVIDEAQGIPGIGLILKIIVDKIKGIQVIATGSSAFELMNNTSEPLTGRKFEFRLFPFSFSEMVKDHGFLEEMRMLEFRLVYGYYPEVAINSGQEQKFLKLIAGSYLYKDLLRLENIRRSELLDKILKALALQLGSEVSYNELAKLCGTDPKTVEKYINILEKTFIIFKLPALSRNVRNELKKGKKIYFWDNGIRNAIINNFTETISLRNDLGAMWENFIISERMKLHNYHQTNINCYFWRTSQQQEIDFIEEHRSGFKAFEFKWSKSAKTVFSKTFLFNYNVIKTKVITKNNLESFLLEPSF